MTAHPTHKATTPITIPAIPPSLKELDDDFEFPLLCEFVGLFAGLGVGADVSRYNTKGPTVAGMMSDDACNKAPQPFSRAFD